MNIDTTKTTFCCRICEKDVAIETLKKHSIKCKEYHCLQDEYKRCNEELQKKIDDCELLCLELQKLIAYYKKEKQANRGKMNQLTLGWKAFKIITQYGDKAARNQFDFDLKCKFLIL